METEIEVAREIEDIHDAFAAWFTASVPADDGTFERLLARRFEAGFTIVPPHGRATPERELLDGLRGAHGADSGLEIRIRNVRLLHEPGDLAIATYEEWQRTDQPSRPPLTARTSTVILRKRPAGWGWLHVHETWLPSTDGHPFAT